MRRWLVAILAGVGALLGCAVAAAAGGPAVRHWTASQVALYEWEHGAHFSASGCRLLPSQYASECLLDTYTATEREYLYYWNHDANFKLPQCSLLPPVLLQPCNVAVRVQLANPKAATESYAERQSYVSLFLGDAHFTAAECALLPAKYVSACVATAPAVAAAVVPITFSPVIAEVFGNPGSTGSGPIVFTDTTPPLFTQTFPVIDFCRWIPGARCQTPPGSVGSQSCAWDQLSSSTSLTESCGPIPASWTCGSTVLAKLDTQAVFDAEPRPDGACALIALQGNGLVAGVGTLYNFQAAFTGLLTVTSAPVDIAFTLWSDDGWVLGIAPDGTALPEQISGSMVNAPATTALDAYPVLGAYNQASAAVLNRLVIAFPKAGTYPFELDYSNCCGGGSTIVMKATGAVGS